MNVSQMLNSNGNAAINQFIITTDLGQYFKSYNTLIAFKPRCGSTPVLTKAWCQSATTTKHLKLFLNTSLSKQELQKRIDWGSLILDDNLEIK
ncbi:hypothetical protein S14_226 [Shewanella sp. phage 1/4]|uniref:hypothetical protein n=1 Tax=Shewanella phage 1/4 TaxID=1458859 RepID=UPI0004F59893|nr:hypothetical protein S14_226 [Shewanella sp. phage 1/4]AHK11335.1 hypothetical protein S14_226 [Shewanella sp. phage 1/4]